MLILDKQKAVDRIVALTAGRASADPEELAARPGRRAYHRVATYERRAPAAADTAIPAPPPAPASGRRRRSAPFPA